MKVLLLLLLLITAVFSSRGIQIKTSHNEVVEMPYQNSYALLVGVSDYTNGWPDLESIPGELQKIEESLKKQGFHTRMILNPKSDELFESFDKFVNDYGYKKTNRLFFFYSGHGYTANNGTKGYLVPSDAPNPELDLRAFQKKAMNMQRLITLSREMESNHAMFLFDSCFSGVIFKTRALPKLPPYIQKSMAKPIRQFITAGSANEEVPSRSTFAPMFIDAIEGKADLNNDGYVTGSELGMYMSQSLPNYSNQSPQYGKIKDYDLSQGDFIFVPTTNQKIKFKLNVMVKPINASIRILNSNLSYRHGIELKKDTYQIKIEKDGYISQIMTIEMFKDVEVHITLEKIQLNKYVVNIKTNPNDAKILIISTGADKNEYQYFDGLNLNRGSYKVVISKEGYITKKQYLAVYSTKNLDISLEKIKEEEYYVKITTVPSNANILITSTGTDKKEYKYFDGLKLAQGSYTIVMSKDGYVTKNQDVSISNEKDLTFSLEKIKEKEYEVKITTVPKGALIVISGEKEYTYFDGIKLLKGDYVVKISKHGYLSQQHNLSLYNDVNLNFSLEKIVVEKDNYEEVKIEEIKEKPKKKIFFGF